MSSQPVHWGGGRPIEPPDGQVDVQAPQEVRESLEAQLEELLGAVQAAEAEWRFDDRLDLAARLDPSGFGRRRA